MSVLTITTENRQTGFRGGRGDTQEKPCEGARETLCDAALLGQPMDIRKRSFIGSHQGVGGAHSTARIPKTT
jgi:hypothetical protein